jgi:hypothetical protein
MEQSRRVEWNSNDQHVLLDSLREEQQQYSEGSLGWSLVQDKMNQIIAENYLRYLNR